MTDVSIVGAVLAGLVSFLSPCVLPLVPGYASMLSGIGMEQLRQGQPPRAGLFATSLAFVAGFSSVFISFGASASAVGQFLRENRALLAPVAGALILMFGLHLLGWLVKLSLRVGITLGILFVIVGFLSSLRGGPLFGEFRMIHFFSFALIGFLGPASARKASSFNSNCGNISCWARCRSISRVTRHLPADHLPRLSALVIQCISGMIAIRGCASITRCSNVVPDRAQPTIKTKGFIQILSVRSYQVSGSSSPC